MHKGVILLTKAENREEAEQLVHEFLEPYGEGYIWDWYSIGNRWNNTLAPKDLMKEFNEWIHDEYKDVFDKNGYYSIDSLENKKDREIIQEKWKSLGLKGYNSYYSSYGFNLPEDDKDNYNVVPLLECVESVKEWVKDLEQEKEKLWKEMIKAKKNAKKGNYDSSGYYAGLYKDAQYGNFCFESNVYNITEEIAEIIPDNIEDYWAVIVDMHN